MKRFVQVVSILIGMAILFSVVSASYVKASPSDSVRVWVEYQKGDKEVVRAALKGVGAKFHYEFDDLDSFGIWTDDYGKFLEMRGKRVVEEINKRLNPVL